MYKKLIAVGLSVLTIIVGANTGSVVYAQTRTREERLEAYRQSFIVDAARIQTVQERCSDAQIKLGTVRTKMEDVIRRKKAHYNEIATRLYSLSGRLSNQDIQLDSFQEAITDLKIMTENLDGHYQNYLTSLDDARQIECTGDVVGFLSALHSARGELVIINNTQKEIEATILQVTQTILPAIKSLV